MSEVTESGDPRIERLLISEAELRQRVKELAVEITAVYRDADFLDVVTILKGAFIFAADLAREIHKAGGPAIRFHFLRASAYGASIKSDNETGRDVLLQNIPDTLRERHVLLVEDILDQGFTLARIQQALRQRGVGSLRLCVLIEKELAAPTREVAALRAELAVDFRGFTVEDRWVAGYGLDVGEEFRELPSVVIIDEIFFQ